MRDHHRVVVLLCLMLLLAFEVSLLLSLPQKIVLTVARIQPD